MTRPTPETLAAIKALAGKATPGPWEQSVMVAKEGVKWEVEPGPGDMVTGVCDCGFDSSRPNNDAAFIAACDPQTVMGLIEALGEAWAKIEADRLAANAAIAALDRTEACGSGAPCEAPTHAAVMALLPIANPDADENWKALAPIAWRR